MKKMKNRLTYTQMIALGFLLIIFVGSLLLMMPVSSRTGTATPFLNALFTATSATCVTGLSVYDTFTHWSGFGQAVILLLIQIGGLGFMTVITLFFLLMKKQIQLKERRLLMQSAGNLTLGGVIRLVRKILIGTLCFELIGAILLSFRFCRQLGLSTGIWYAVFHSVSAFCNAGFDLMGRFEPSSSLAPYATDPLVILTIVSLILIGGLGFIVWNDLYEHKWHFSKYHLHTKIILTASAVLVLIPTALFFITESGGALKDYSLGERWLISLFLAVTPRTAGFLTIPLNELSESGGLLTMGLMLIGGSPGSTAGGIKITTFTVLVLGMIAAARHESKVVLFKRQLEPGSVREASSVITIYALFIFAAAFIICALEPVSLKDCLFETISAAGTVGLSAGITSGLGVISKLCLIILMFGGRVGLLSLALVLAEKREHVPLERPTEKILIG